MSARIMDDAAQILANPQAYADEKRLHDALAHLRAHVPVSWVDVEGYKPFWAITKHADVMDIERQNDLFTNDPRPLLMIAEGEDVLRAQMEAGIGLRTLIHMDDPHHRDMRKIGADWFRPKVLRDLKVRVDELAKIYVGKMVENGPECDFVQEVAVNYPLYVILSLLGLPESDFPRMLKLTQEMFGGDDTEFQRGGTTEDMLAVLLDFFNYFAALTASRREHPTEDLASAIANATINGEPLSDMDTASYYVIVASAGHDTTSAGIAEGHRPDGYRRRRDDPLRGAGQGIHAHRAGGHRGARRADRQGRIGAAVVRVGEPRRGGVQGPDALRRRSGSQQAPVVRVRRALLSGRRVGPDGDEQLLLRTRAADQLDRAGRRAGADGHDLRRRPQTLANPLLAEVI
jgi:hypothetical protein